MTQSLSDQHEALKRLFKLYCHMGYWGLPEYQQLDTGDRFAFVLLVQRGELRQSVQDAKVALAASGLDFDDSWLLPGCAVHVHAGQPVSEEDRRNPDVVLDPTFVGQPIPESDQKNLNMIETQMYVRITRLEGELQAECKANANAETTPANTKLGVSLLDVALLLNDDNEEAAKDTRDRWQRQRTPRLPKSIGFCPTHSQTKLYAPYAICAFAEKTEGPEKCRNLKLRQRVKDVARKPRPEA